jgi:hypothetical protein
MRGAQTGDSYAIQPSTHIMIKSSGMGAPRSIIKPPRAISALPFPLFLHCAATPTKLRWPHSFNAFFTLPIAVWASPLAS